MNVPSAFESCQNIPSWYIASPLREIRYISDNFATPDFLLLYVCSWQVPLKSWYQNSLLIRELAAVTADEAVQTVVHTRAAWEGTTRMLVDWRMMKKVLSTLSMR